MFYYTLCTHINNVEKLFVGNEVQTGWFVIMARKCIGLHVFLCSMYVYMYIMNDLTGSALIISVFVYSYSSTSKKDSFSVETTLQTFIERKSTN